MKNTKAQKNFINDLDQELQNDPEMSLGGFGIKQMLEEEKEMIMNDMYMPEDEVQNQIEDFALGY